jgi:hypothetical protein
MKIGIIIGRIGGVDGVALETEKWIEVLRRMGHEIFILSGQFQDWIIDPRHDTLAIEMSFFSPECSWSQKIAFSDSYGDVQEIIDHIEFHSKIIADRIIQWVHEKKTGSDNFRECIGFTCAS